MFSLKCYTKCCVLVVVTLCLVSSLLAAPHKHKRNRSVVRISDENTGWRYNVYYFENLTGYAIRLLQPRRNRIKDKYGGISKEISVERPVNMLENTSNVNVVSTTVATPMRNCTKPVGREGQTGVAPVTPKDPCLDPDYYDEDEDDLGDRLGQNAVLSLLG